MMGCCGELRYYLILDLEVSEWRLGVEDESDWDWGFCSFDCRYDLRMAFRGQRL